MADKNIEEDQELILIEKMSDDQVLITIYYMTDYTFMQQIFYKIVYDEYIIDNITKSKFIGTWIVNSIHNCQCLYWNTNISIRNVMRIKE